MTTRGKLRPLLRLLGPAASALVLACVLAACQKQEPAQPPAPPPAPVAKIPTKEQAMARLMELPEVRMWSAQIEKASHGKAHGAVIEDDPDPRIINGKPYWQFTFVENRADVVHRRESFLVAHSGDEVLIEDTRTNTVLTLPEWRRTVHKVELRSAE
jgi:hypothetical protein